MKDNTVLILGGYSNAGLAIARLLVSQTKVGIVRYAATQIPELESAPVASVFEVNWKEREYASSSSAEFVDELKSLNSLVLKNGTWQPGNSRTWPAWACGST